jgi:hypothetical protein
MGRTLRAVLLLGFAAMFFGCTLAYQPPLDVSSAPYVFSGKGGSLDPIRIEDVTDQDTVLVSRTGQFTYNANLAKFGEAIVASLERELVKNGFQVTPEATKAIRIDVIDVEMAYPKKYRCDINVAIGAGDKTIGIATDSPASMVYTEAIDAAIADAVRRIMGNEDVVAFLTSKP